jgi:hypothetical protein
MAVADLILSRGEILVQQGNPISLFYSTEMLFGTVINVYATCDSVAIGDYVSFDPKKVKTIVYGSTVYKIVDEKDISGSQTPPP